MNQDTGKISSKINNSFHIHDDLGDVRRIIESFCNFMFKIYTNCEMRMCTYQVRGLFLLFFFLWNFSFSSSQSLNLKFDHITLNEGLPQNTIHGIAKDKHGFMWFGTWSGLCRYDGYKMRVYRYSPSNPKSIINSRIHNIIVDKRQDIWIRTIDAQFICKYNFESDDFDRIPVDMADPDILAALNHREHIMGLQFGYRDYQWQLDTYTNALVETYNPTGATTVYQHNPYNPWSLSDQQISDMYLDDQNILWVGTYNNGINKAILHPNIQHWYHDPNNHHSMNEPAIRSICKDLDDNTWIGTRSKGISVKRKDGSFTHFQQDEKSENTLASNYIYKVFCDSEGMIWVGTRRGLNRINPKTNRIQRWEEYDLNYIRVVEIIEDKNRDIWLATHKGIYKYVRKDDSFTYYDPTTYQSTRFVSTIFIDSQDQIWTGNETEGVYILKENARDGRLTVVDHLTHDTTNISSISDNRIICVLEDKNKQIWIGTGNGLDKFDSKHKTVTRFSGKPDGLPESTIAGIITDNSGNIWCSHKRGMSKIDVANNSVRNFNKKMAYQGNEFSEGAVYRDEKDNMLYFGGSHGINVFCPDSLVIDTVAPKVVLTELQILNRTVEVDDTINGRVILKKPLYLTSSLDLTYPDKSVAFEFSALHFTHPASNKYAYMLEGFDEDWVYTDASQRIASYSNLSPGNYTFKVKAANSDGVWNELPTTLAVTVAPAWWASGWAYLCYTVFLFAVLITVYYYLVRYDRLRNKLTYEALLHEKERELHQSKIQFFTNISHEIKTPLTLILSPIQQLNDAVANLPKATSLLSTMQKNGVKLLKIVNQLLDIRRLESGYEQLQLTQLDIVEFTRGVVKYFQELAHEREITLRFTSDEKKLLASVDADKMEKILNNLLSNALKFTSKGGEVNVSISLVAQSVKIAVTDNGIGISAGDLENIFVPFKQSKHNNPTGSGLGLSYARSLVELHNGTLSADSLQTATRNITTFTISLPVTVINHTSSRTILTTDEENTEQLTVSDEAAKECPSTSELVSLHEKPTLLLVEDNVEMREYLHSYFEKDYHILEAEDGVIGLDMVRKHLPDLVISDVMMPHMDGIIFCSHVKSDLATGHIPMIMLTARSLPEFEMEGLKTGADDYIVKPFNIDLLALKVKNQLLNRVRLQEKFRLKIAVAPKEVEHTSPDEKFLQKVMHYVEDHIAEPDLRIEDVCDSVGLSRAQIYRKMKALTGYSMADMIREVRLKRAQQLLRDKKFNISEIAFMVGFSDVNYFRKSFKAKYGQSPSDYAKQYNN